MPVLGIDRDGRLTYANDSLYALTGYDSDEVLGRPFWEFILGEDAQFRRDRFLRLRDEGIDSRFDARIATRTGRDLLIAWHNVSFFDTEGRLEAVYSIGADITALRGAEKRLERLNTTLRALSGISGLALRVQDARELLERACETLVTTGACTGAWVALVGDSSRPIGLAGSPMRDGASPEVVSAALRELPDCIARVLHGPRQVAINEISEACGQCIFAPQDPDVHGMATAVGHGEQVSAVLVTHVPNSEPVGEETQRLFLGIADELGFALAMLEARAMHQRTERALAERTRILDAFFESSLDPAAILDRDMDFLRVNQAYADAGALEPHEFIGRNHFEMYPNEENQAIFERVRDTGEPFEVHAKPFEYADHPEWGVTWWDWALVPHLDDDGEVELLSLWLRDVTEEQRAKLALEEQRDRLDELVRERTRELQRANELLEAVVEESPVAVVVHDAEGNVTLWNPAAEEISGWSEEEALGGPPPLVPPDKQEEFRRNLRIIADGGKIRAVPFERERRDGKRLQLELSAAPLHDAEGRYVGSVVLFSDVTEREAAARERERLLRELEEERATLEAIIKNAPAGIIVADEQARILLANPAAEAIYRRAVPIGQDRASHSTLQLCHPDGTPIDADELPLSRSALHGEVIHRRELAIIWPDGQQRDLDASSAPIRTPDGEITGAVGIFWDITEAKANERERERLMKLLEDYADHLEEMVGERTHELALSRDQLRTQRDFVDAVIERAGGLVVVVDSQGRIVRFNEAAERVSGWSAGEVRGRDFIEVLLPEAEQGRVREDFLGRLREGPADYEVWWQCRDGGRRRISWRVSTIQGQDGRMQYMIGTGWDVTEERRMERELRESEEKYRELVENARTIIIRWDLDGTIRFINEYGLELFGYAEHEMVGAHVGLIVPDVDSHGIDLTGLVEAIATAPDEYWMNENENVAKDGTRYWVSWSNRVVRDAEGTVIGIMAIGVDRTAERRAEQQLRASQEDLRDLAAEIAMVEQRERREIATVLHDNIGQLLAFAKMKLDAMVDREMADQSDLRQLLRYVDEAIGETRALTSQLAPPVLVQLEFVVALQWLADDLSDRHGLPVHFSATAEPEKMSEEVTVTLFQATRELIVNAIKHAGAGQVSVRLWLKDNLVCIEVADDGTGFDPSALQDRKRHEGGFGLLNVQERISYLGGEVQIESAAGKGTAITLICPNTAKETTLL